MKKIGIGEIIEMTGGKLLSRNGSLFATGVAVDSRLVKENDIFFALSGTVTNGHKFLKNAVENGASVLVVSEFVDDGEYPVSIISVKDTFEAFKAMAKRYREMFDIPFVAVTGSSGKTTTKDIIASVLSEKYRVHKTQGNLNSSTGAPLTVFELDDSHEISVVEMSMSARGEILANADIVRPNTVVMTNIGVCHIEFLKTQENIFKAKCEILTYMEKGNTLILNADDKFLNTITSDVFDIKRIGLENGDIRAFDVSNSGEGISFSVMINGEKNDFKFGYAGKHNIRNCLCAICVGLKYGLSVEQIAKGLLAFKPSQNRMETTSVGGVTLINDTYNANPDSVTAALNAMTSQTNGRKIAVLGDMYELGDYTEKMHVKCGGAAFKCSVDMLFVIGKYAEYYLNGYISCGGTNYMHCADKNDAVKKVLKYVKPGDTVLLKASRGVKLEEVFINLKEGLSEG